MLENAAGFKTKKDDVFGRIASKYDLLCDLFSFGIHRVWKSRVASIIADAQWSTFLDTASGTGDIALRVIRKADISSNKRIIVSDISEKMLEIAKLRISKTNTSNVEIRLIDACSMPEIGSESIELFSMSLGLKICERTSALKEAFRVLKPSGRLVVLEASNIPIKLVHRLYLKYMAIVMPLIGWLATNGDASAYRYLLQGVEAFPTAEELCSELAEIGFEEISFERLSFGIVAIHVAVKPNCNA
ncbi:ubiquinone/menaquinone biosynthesis methyltransferase [Undibacterium sp. Di24W]|uniref:ubiquinone/menaquinone biosynthesis methyltransferase n=1 Tax=Undibacterium sp. Di24W TaxID=3413033 RepID=UPI003BF26415